MTKRDDLIARGQARHGDKWTDADLAEKFWPYYASGARIKVTSPGGFTRTGTVGVTTGWRPAFLLMHRSDAMSSWDVLSASDEVVAVKRGRRYVKLTTEAM